MNTVSVNYKGKTYFVSEFDLNNDEKLSVFAFTDIGLNTVAEENGGTLLIRKSEIFETLKK